MKKYQEFKLTMAYRMDKWFRKSVLVHMVTLVLLVGLATWIGAIFSLLDSLTLDHLGERLWWAFLRLSDPGYLGDDQGFWTVFVGTVLIVLGLAFFGLLVTMISNAFEERMASIKSGRRAIYEKHHVLVLGWGEVVYTTLDELMRGQDDNGEEHLPIVVLSDRDRGEMEEEIAANCAHARKGRIICRTGNPAHPADLERVCLLAARQVIVLSDESLETPHLSDVMSINILLALLKSFKANGSRLEIEPADGWDGRLKVAISVHTQHSYEIVEYLKSLQGNIASPRKGLGRLRRFADGNRPRPSRVARSLPPFVSA